MTTPGIRRGAVWLRGAVPNIPPLLQPVAHSLIQVAEDLPKELEHLPEEALWTRLGESAPIGFHLAHLIGSLDRLVTYARGEALSDDQLRTLEGERRLAETRPSLLDLLARLDETVQRALRQLEGTPPDVLLEPREVGRGKLPSNTLGLLFHAAEHSTRHAGQIATLLRVLKGTKELG